MHGETGASHANRKRYLRRVRSCYVSVSSQSDTERADLAREERELADDPEAERREFAGIYERHGLEPSLALQVADQLTARDALGAHERHPTARPVQAALTSALTFAVGASLPLVIAMLVPPSRLVAAVSLGALIFLAVLAVLAALGAQAGGAGKLRAAIRVVFWGVLAMALTAGIGRLFGAVV